MEMIQETVTESTDVGQKIVQEIHLIPDNKLAMLYQFIHYFRLGIEVASNGAAVGSNDSHPEFLNHQEESEIIEEESGSTTDKNEHEMSSQEITLSLAGAWSNMPDEEFDDFLSDIYARRQGKHLTTDKSEPNSLTMAEMLERVKDDKADWLIFCEAALRVGNFRSLDQIILQALDAWFKQLPPELRWDIAIELYTNEEISSGKAAEIAGLNYFVFLEELRAHGIKFIAAEMPEGEAREKQEALLDELFAF